MYRRVASGAFDTTVPDEGPTEVELVLPLSIYRWIVGHLPPDDPTTAPFRETLSRIDAGMANAGAPEGPH